MSSWLTRAYTSTRGWLDPEWPAQRQLLHDLAAATRQLAARAEDDAARERTRLDELASGLRAQQQAVNGLSRDVGWLRQAALRQRRVSARLLRRAELDERTAQHEQQLRGRLQRISRSRLPVVVGPWTGEVGFELLYWVPFLQWVCDSFPIDRERLIVISRGGVASWYGGIAERYFDVFEHVTPDAFRDATEAVKKQRDPRGFERGMIRAAMRTYGVTRAHLLHPSLMYNLFWAYWAYTASWRHVDEFAAFKRLTPPAVPGLRESLPASYVAVRFYFSRCLPDTAAARTFIDGVLRSLTAQTDVVLLDTPFTVDDHRDFTAQHGGRVHRVSDRMTPETNLAVQAAVIAGARAFVGTYGGYSYLAPLYGVDSIAFYSKANFKRQHLDLAHRVFDRLGTARLLPVDIQAAASLQLAFGS